MRIGLISTMDSPVRQNGSGSIETLVWLLSRELTALGHDVTVFAAGGSEPHGELFATLPGPCGTEGSPHEYEVCEWINHCRAVEQSDRFDVLHSHGYLWGLPLHRLARAPMVHTLHLWPHTNEATLWTLAPEACVTAISNCQWSRFPKLEPTATIYHGIDVSQFIFRPRPD